ncbi:sec-independent protein translocase protein TatA [Knoellia remsis]|uniref:Sec-independent protein translocase protein TatA n=1 Tax=Knoellia remsis TaxID=407159 RepID=A0A2T0UAJ9_9MICO|nr:Sec-independent protein translocase subunit TatA [Knoellia remsis]PRY54847.1 sec-independent protein translocase protein TatA [Knoellia remsis]
MRNIGAPEIIIIAVLLIVIFGWKRLPDAARSLGRSARVFKSEVDEMKTDGKKDAGSTTTTASTSTLPGETVRTQTDPTAPRSTSPIHEDAPRTDNQSGPISS